MRQSCRWGGWPPTQVWVRLSLVMLCVLRPAGAQEPLTVERIWGSNDLVADLVSIQWAPDGRFFTTIESDRGVTDLIRVEAVTGRRERLIVGSELFAPGAATPFPIEGYEFSPDRRRVLLFTNSQRVWRQNTKGEYYVWDLDAGRLYPVSGAPGFQMFAKFAPNSQLVGFVRDHDLFVSDYQAGREWRITTDGSDDIINGTADWVYEEELGLRDAFRISPDGRRIAFWRLNQSAIPPFYLLDETSLYPELRPVRYPKAGRANSRVQIGVAVIATGETQWVDLGSEEDIYIAAMDFADSSDELWLTRLNRHQNRLDVVLVDAATGRSRVIMTDRDEAWIDATVPIWFDDGERFLYLSDRGGYRQLYVFRRDGTEERKLTTAPWDVTGVAAVDHERDLVYFVGTGAGPLERHLYRVRLDGRDLEQITREPGTHSVEFNPTVTHFVDTHSRAGVPPVQRLRRADGTSVRDITTNDPLRERLADLTPPEFLTIPGAAGESLHAFVIKPPHFDPNRVYPLVMYVYGGPGSQTVTDGWGGQRYLWHQLLAQQGYLVASVDNRGTGARGAAFKKQTYRRLGQLESDDQIAAARYLATLPYVDGGRIGIWGWSYGGYMSSLSLLRGGGTFRAAIAVAPVTDWRLYDTIYTERYMRTPEENPDGYRLGAPLTYADRLEGALLLVHGTGDDNVHAQQTTQMILALEEANKQFDMRLYPNRTHAIAGGVMRVNLYGYMTEWLRRNLYAGASVADQIP